MTHFESVLLTALASPAEEPFERALRRAAAVRRDPRYEAALDTRRAELVLLSDEELRERALASAIRDEVPRAQLIEIVASHEVGHELMVGGRW